MSTFYVATTGSDANTGDYTAPFLTITKGVSVAAPGDTIVVRDGSYPAAAAISVNLAGITIKAANKLGATLTGGGAANYYFDLGAASAGVAIDGFGITNTLLAGIHAASGGATGCIVRNCNIFSNAGAGLLTDNAATLAIQNTRFSGNGTNGIETASPGLLVSNCIFCSAGTGWHIKALAGFFGTIRGSWFFDPCGGGNGHISLQGAEQEITITSCISYNPTVCFITSSGLTFTTLVMTLNNMFGAGITLQDFVGGFTQSNLPLPATSYPNSFPCGTPGAGTEDIPVADGGGGVPPPPPLPPPTTTPPPPPSPSSPSGSPSAGTVAATSGKAQVTPTSQAGSGSGNLSSESQSVLPTITREDLLDPAMASTKLNNLFQFLASQIASTQGSSGTSSFRGHVTGKTFKASDTSVPADPSSLLTKAAADALYSKKA